MDSPKTVVHALHDQATRRQYRPALWTRRGRAYVPTSWHEYAVRVRRFALGLHALGFRAGSVLALLSFNREEWLVADVAALALGGVSVGLSTASSPEQVRAVLAHCEAEVVVVEHEQHLATVQAVRAHLPRLRHVILLELSTTGSLPEDTLLYADVQARGASVDEGPYWDAVNALRPEALATLLYRLDGNGPPRGVMLSHHNLVWAAERLRGALELHGEDEALLSYLPLSSIAEQLLSLHGALLAGVQVYFAGSPESVLDDLREVRPTLFFAVPHRWEQFKARLEDALREQPPAAQRVIAWARGVASERHARALRHERTPLHLEAQYQVAQRTVFQSLRQRLGLERAHFLATGTAPIGREVLDFFASLDMVLREGHGHAEASGPLSLNTREATHLGSVGRPLVGVELRITQDGQVLVRGGGNCLGYYKDPEASAALLHEGWLRTGDVGHLDAEGFLHLKAG
jgi:long-chain acyl-CoA synthetase